MQKHELCEYARKNKQTRSQRRKAFSEIPNPDTKCHRAVTYPELDLALKEFVLIYQNRTILSDALLVEKAKLLADGLRIPQGVLKFSNGWLEKFKDRNRIRQHHLEGEAESADITAINNTIPLLRNKTSNYPLERIYNMDETGLFYRLEPDRTLATQRLSGRKVERECLSITLCTNADGLHKLAPFVIRKYAKPCCFKNIKIQNLAVKYRNSAKAWMIATLFQDWLKNFDYQIGLKHRGQHVLLILNNCASHKLDALTLQYTDITFLPPNITSKIQLLDAEQIENGGRADELKMNVLQAIRFIIQSWEEVTAEIIRNCWRHTEILFTDANTNLKNLSDQTMDLELDELDDLTDALASLHPYLTYPMQVEEFLSIPDEDIVYELPDDDQVITELADTFRTVDLTTDSSKQMEDDDSNEVTIITTDTAMKSLETVQTFLLQQDNNTNEYIKAARKIEAFIRTIKLNQMQQRKL
ncbi:1311_t:CDS:2, partial [Racocetra persica]